MKKKIEITLLIERSKFTRLDVLPFVPIYIGLLFWMNVINAEEDVIPSISLLVLIFIHCLIFLIGNWSHAMKSIIAYKSVSLKKKLELNDLEQYSAVKVKFKPKDR